MRKFKLFMASVLTYFMAMSILPTALFQTVANASENDYIKFVKSDYYLKGNAQYSDEALIAYGKSRDGDTQISIVKNGQETLLKEVKGYSTVQVFSNGDYRAGIVYSKWENENYNETFEEFNFKTKEFKAITKEEFANISGIKKGDYVPYAPIKDKNELNKYFNRFNEKYNLNLNVEDKEYSEESGNWQGKNGSNTSVNIWNDYNNKDIELMNYSEYDSENGSVVRYSGLIYKDYVYISKSYGYGDIQYNTGSNNNIYIWGNIEGNNYNLVQVKYGKEISNGNITLEDNVYPYLKELDNKIYINDYDKVYIYELVGNKYNLLNSIENLGLNLNSSKPILLEKNEEKIYLSEINGSQVSKIIELTKEINSIKNDDYNYFNIYEENGQISIVTPKGFILLQKPSRDTGNNEETPKPQEPVTPTKPGDNGETKPSEDKVVTEVPRINPNEKNEIAVKTTEGTKNIEVVIKDIEAIKNGNGSLNIVTDSGFKINLPLSAIDKSLLEGAKDVTIKLDIIDNSDIVKNIKGVNKVFDFNLIINKEDGTTNVHNFKEGLVEVKINLTDKDFEGLNKDKIVVYYYNDSSKAFEEMETSVNGNEVTFKTPHFSKYVIAEKIETKNEETPANEGDNGNKPSTENKTETGKGQLPETGARVSNTTILVLAVGMLAIGGAMFFRKRKHA